MHAYKHNLLSDISVLSSYLLVQKDLDFIKDFMLVIMPLQITKCTLFLSNLLQYKVIFIASKILVIFFHLNARCSFLEGE